MSIDFVDRVKTKLTAAVSATDTLLPCWGGDLAQFRPGGVDTYAVIRNAERAETVKVTGIQPFTGLVVERGQDGSTPRAFAAGAIVSARLVKGSLSHCQQKGVMRQVAYNPNAVLMPAYFGEKVAETGVEGCTHRIWQNVQQDAPAWRLVYGAPCKDLTSWRDWNWAAIEIPWPWWPWTPPITDTPGEGNIFVGGMIVSGGISCSGSLVADYLVCNKEGQSNSISAGGDIKTDSCICSAVNVWAGGNIESNSSITISGFLSSGGDITGELVLADLGISSGGSITSTGANQGIFSDEGGVTAVGNITSATVIRAKTEVTAGGTVTAPGGVIITG